MKRQAPALPRLTMAAATPTTAERTDMDTLERQLTTLRSRVIALERVVASLIATHPDKLAFAANLEKSVEIVIAMHLSDAHVSDETREQQRQMALEFAGLARDYAARAATRGPAADPALPHRKTGAGPD